MNHWIIQTMNKKITNCPICKEQYYSISKSINVCEEHEDWIITKCFKCGRLSFSDEIGLCIKCAKNILKLSVRDIEEFE